MTILEAIELANTEADIRSFRFAKIDEFSAFMESFNFEDYPCNVLEPFTTSGVWLNGRTKTTVPLNGWILKRINEDTSTFRTAKVESIHLAPMRDKARAFIKALLSSEEADDIIDPEVEEVQFSIKPEYAFLSAHLFGVSYQITLPVRESIC